MAGSNKSWFGSAFWQQMYGLFTRSEEPLNDTNTSKKRNGGIITLCILSSFLLWFLSSMGETYDYEFKFPVQIVGIPQDLVLSSPPPDTITVNASGEGIDLLSLYYTPQLILIDGSKNQVSLESAVLQQLQPNIQIEGISPASVLLQKEKKIQKRVPLLLRHRINVPSTHDLVQNFRLEPDSVTIGGPANLVDQITDWPTVPSEEITLVDSLRMIVSLSDTLAPLIELSHSNVLLTAVAENFTEGSKILTVNLEGVPSSERVITLEPSRIEIRYRVPLSQFTRVENANDMYASVSYNAIRADTTGFITPTVVMPPDVVFKNIEYIPRALRYFDILQEDE